MPIGPGVSDPLTARIIQLYSDAELALLRMIAARINEGRDVPNWVELKLLQLGLLTAQAQGLLDNLEDQVTREIVLAMVQAYNRGAATAVADIDAALQRNRGFPGIPPVEVMAAELQRDLIGTHRSILRSVTDSYTRLIRDVIGANSANVLLGVMTRRQASQQALREMVVEHSLTSFKDRRGRRWEIQSYAEMATRAGTANAAIQGHVDRLILNGHDLVAVSDAPQECKLCRPFEGKILSLLGAPAPAGVNVTATLDQARRKGLFHPGCRHSIKLYIHGVTKLTPHGPTADPQGDRDRQRLRYLERQLRKWKTVQALDEEFGDPLDRMESAGKVRGYQAKIREHVATSTAKRQPQREQIGNLPDGTPRAR